MKLENTGKVDGLVKRLKEVDDMCNGLRYKIEETRDKVDKSICISIYSYGCESSVKVDEKIIELLLASLHKEKAEILEKIEEL